MKILSAKPTHFNYVMMLILLYRPDKVLDFYSLQITFKTKMALALWCWKLSLHLSCWDTDSVWVPNALLPIQFLGNAPEKAAENGRHVEQVWVLNFCLQPGLAKLWWPFRVQGSVPLWTTIPCELTGRWMGNREVWLKLPLQCVKNHFCRLSAGG